MFAQNRYPTRGCVPRNVRCNETFRSNVNADIFERDNFHTSRIAAATLRFNGIVMRWEHLIIESTKANSSDGNSSRASTYTTIKKVNLKDATFIELSETVGRHFFLFGTSILDF